MLNNPEDVWWGKVDRFRVLQSGCAAQKYEIRWLVPDGSLVVPLQGGFMPTWQPYPTPPGATGRMLLDGCQQPGFRLHERPAWATPGSSPYVQMFVTYTVYKPAP